MEILKDGAGRLLFDSASEGLLVANKSGQILVANHRLEEMFGYASDELIGQPVEVLIPMNLRHKHVGERTEYNKAPRKRSMGGDLDLCAVRKDASEFPVEISLNHLKHNEETLIVALVTDITERKEAKEKLGKLNQSLESMVEERTEKLKESQLLYRTISRNFPNGTINVFDRDLNYVFAEGQELFRYKLSSEALVGTSYLNRLPEDVRDEIGDRLKKVFEG
ncbi:MAG: PAS domain S-box protein, partial [Flavobacteriales bacterium]|nr:PAS domain S-box protein [Flavobacteriales bacterium]